MLAGDYLCYAQLAHDRGIDPHCRLCHLLSNHPAPAENLEHLITRCIATADTRTRIMPEILITLTANFPQNRLLYSPTQNTLTQFVLDCSSLNLPSDIRIPPSHPDFYSITKLCSSLVFALHKDRTRQLKSLGLI